MAVLPNPVAQLIITEPLADNRVMASRSTSTCSSLRGVLNMTLLEGNSVLSRLLRFNICTAYAKGNLISSSTTVKGCRYLT